MNHQWLRVNREHPCTACGKTDWCTYCPEINRACCMRIQSDRPAKNGGWLHKINGAFKPTPKPTRAKSSFSAAQYYEWKGRNDAPMDAQKYLNNLGCDPAAWYRLGVTWAREYQAWAIPMRDGNEQIIGIQLRYLDGSKRAVKGSKNGLFVPDQPASGFAVICEGASDTAAAITIGYYAIGRQSCAGGGDMLKQLLQRKGIDRIAFVSDNDTPGIDGAMRISREIQLPYCFLVPPTKDLREYVQLGGSREMLNAQIEQCVWTHHNS